MLWYGSRHYDPELGRFIQPDSIVPLASQGAQAWDRYAYVNNNPVRYNDPSGHGLCEFLVGLLGISYSCPTDGGGWIEGFDPVHEDIGLEINVPVEEVTNLEGFDPVPEDNWVEGFDPAPEDNGLETFDSVESENSLQVDAWEVGDPINDPTNNGYPSWSTVQSRYWKNRAQSALPGEFSDANLARMKNGDPPLHDELGVSMELHHINGRRIIDPHNINNLQEYWPWEHDDNDRYRHYRGPRPNET